MFEDNEQLIAPLAAIGALGLSLLLFAVGAGILIRVFRWAGKNLRAATGLGAPSWGLALLLSLYFVPGPFIFVVTLFVFLIRFVIYSLPVALIALAQQLPQACAENKVGSACADPILTVALQLWGRPKPPLSSTQSGAAIQRLNSIWDAVQFITSPPPAFGLPRSLISVVLIATVCMALLWVLPRALEGARHVNWHNQSILKSVGLAASLIFALYLSLTAIVVIPVFNDTADRLTEGKSRLKDQLPHLLELYDKSLIAAAVSEDELPDTTGLLERVRQLWDKGPQEETRTIPKAADASVPMSPEPPLQAIAPQAQVTAVGSVNLRTLMKAELQGKILELDRQIADLKESKQSLRRATRDFQQNGQLALETVTEYFEQQNTGHHIGGDLTLRHSTLLVGQYGSWLAQYITNISKCDGEIARSKNEIVVRDGQITQALDRLASSPHPENDPVFSDALIAGPFRGAPNCMNVLPDFGDFFQPRQSPADSLLLFGRATSWLLLTESRDLALIVGMLGFGFFGALATSFIRQVRSSKPLAEAVLIVPALVSGLAAAALIFLAVVGGLAVFTRSTPEPNAYAVFLACFIAAVFSEDVWDWAQRRQREQLAKDSEQGQVNSGQAGPTDPAAPKGDASA